MKNLIEKFDLIVSQIISFAGSDGILHGYICTILTVLFCSLFNFFGLIITTLIAVIKEILDFIFKKDFSKKDLICDSIGIIIGLLLILIA